MSAAAWPLGRTLPEAGRITRPAPRSGAAPSSQLPAGTRVARGTVVAHTAHPMPVPARDSETADEELMLRYAAGDAAAFDVLYERHKGGVFRCLLQIL